MIQFHRFPGGLRRVLTFSFDDGWDCDQRLIDLMDKYGLKGTFHLNGFNYVSKTEEELNAVRERYKNHEIACHTFSHGWPARMPFSSLVTEIMKDREILEKIAGYPVTGMSYPSGSFNNGVTEVMRACGIEYSRTVNGNGDFGLPEDFLKWHPTCHFKGAVSATDWFLKGLDSEWEKPVFYIWGHSHELRDEEDWSKIENLFDRLHGNNKIWYATNMEIYNYVKAQKMLKVSVDEKTFTNPSGIDVWVERDRRDVIKIPAGSTVTVP